jgi:hypothetical protein
LAKLAMAQIFTTYDSPQLANAGLHGQVRRLGFCTELKICTAGWPKNIWQGA